MEHPSGDGPQPPISWWGHTWRVLIMLVVSATALVTSVIEGHRGTGLGIGLDVAGGLVAFGVIWWRRRAPMTVALVTNLLGLFSGLAAGPAVLATASVATRRVTWEILTVGVVAMASAQAYATMNPAEGEQWWVTAIANVFVTVAMIAWGMYVGSRRELLWTLRQRAERAETEQELRVARARVGERAAIAREMHDVLAHRISQISMHAGALSIRTDLDAAALREGTATIQDRANEALRDLRDVLGVLRDAESGELAPRPQPTYDDLPELVAAARDAGLRVELRDRIGTGAEDGPPVPPVVGRTVFRIAQEGITNAAKHAPGAAVVVEVGGTPEGGVHVEVRNPHPVGGLARPASLPDSGLGLLGLSERAELRGGTLTHHDDGHEFVLRGWLPWTT